MSALSHAAQRQWQCQSCQCRLSVVIPLLALLLFIFVASTQGEQLFVSTNFACALTRGNSGIPVCWQRSASPNSYASAPTITAGMITAMTGATAFSTSSSYSGNVGCMFGPGIISNANSCLVSPRDLNDTQSRKAYMQLMNDPAREWTVLAFSTNNYCGVVKSTNALICNGADPVSTNLVFNRPANWSLALPSSLSSLPSGVSIIQIELAASFALFQLSNGTIVCSEQNTLLYCKPANATFFVVKDATNVAGGGKSTSINAAQLDPIIKRRYVQVKANSDFWCALADDGNVECFGDSSSHFYNEIVGDPWLSTGFSSFAGGANSMCGIQFNGYVSCWSSSVLDSNLSPPYVRFSQLVGGPQNDFCGIVYEPDSNSEHLGVQCFGSSGTWVDPYPLDDYWLDITMTSSPAQSWGCGIRSDGTLVCMDGTIPVPISVGDIQPESNFFAVAISSAFPNSVCGLYASTAFTFADASVTPAPPPYSFVKTATRAGYITCRPLKWTLTQSPTWNSMRSLQLIGTTNAYCVLRIDSRVACWAFGLDPSYSDMKTLITTTGYGDVRFVELTAAGPWVCGLTNTGAMHCWRADQTAQWPDVNWARYLAGPFSGISGDQNSATVCLMVGSTRPAPFQCYALGGGNNVPAASYFSGSIGNFNMINIGNSAVCGWNNGKASCYTGPSGPPAGNFPVTNFNPHNWANSTWPNIKKVVQGCTIAIVDSTFGQLADQTVLSGYPTVTNTPAIGHYQLAGYPIATCPSAVFSVRSGGSTALCSGSCYAGYFAANWSSVEYCYDQPCTKGSYCPLHSTLATPCPPGRYGATMKLIDASCTGTCASGYWCAAGSADPLQNSCNAGYYGTQQGLSNPNCTALCPASYYCPPGSSAPDHFACPSSTFYCPLGSGSPLKVPDGFYALNTAADGSMANATAICEAGSTAYAGVKYACTEGRASPNPGASGLQCSQCPSGYYSNAVTGSNSCLPCPVGRFGENPPKSTCRTCSAGWFNNGTGATECTPCAAGSYSIGEESCHSCLPGTYLPTAGSSACFGCEAGRYSNVNSSTTCNNCPVGTYQPNQYATKCLNCPAGKYNSQLGSDSCQDCPSAAYYCPGQTAAPLTVPAGQYATGGNVTTGMNHFSYGPCPQGYSCQSGVTYPCAAGKYSNITGLSDCLPCQSGTRSTLSAASVSCTSCTAGTISDSPTSDQCNNCNEGLFASSTGMSICDQCASGSFSAAGASACTNCAAGSSQSQKGSVACSVCDVGRYSNSVGASLCSACPTGSYQPLTNSTTCLACAPGTYNGQTGSAACTSCPSAAFFCSGGQSAPESAAAGVYTSGGDDSTGFNMHQTAPCPLGYSCQNGVKYACAIGRFSNETGLSGFECKQCQKGTFSSATSGSTSCTACAIGSVSDNPPTDSCVLCSAGFHASSPGMSVCDQCASGTFSYDGAGYCTDCPPGSSQSQKGGVTCTQCEPGRYSNSVGASLCSACPTGSYQPLTNSTTCLACAPGTYNGQTGSAACTSCPSAAFYCPGNTSAALIVPNGYFATGGNADGTASMSVSPCASGSVCINGVATPCSAGTFVNSTGSSCTRCPDGYRSALSSLSTSCVPCPAGEVSTAPTSDVCRPCVEGTFMDRPAQSACFACAAGTSSLAGATQCSNCSFGFYQSQKSSSACLQCEAGRFSDVRGATGCRFCPPGSYQSNTNASSCTVCSAGWISAQAGATLCVECDPGMFQASTNATSCQSCNPGTFANSTASTVCTACEVGKYNPSKGQESCAPCDAGRFSNQTSTIICTAARPGYYVIGTGLTSESPCAIGHYAPSPATSACSVCSGGTFADMSASSTCSLCAAGRYALNGTCIPCSSGKFQSVNGASACSVCSAGTYSLAEATTCDTCGSGTYSLTGSSSCTNCSVGTYAGSEQSIKCLPCSAGKFAAATGATECEDCLPGSYANNNAGASSCDPCEEGYATSDSGQAACTPCSAGFSAAGLGNLVCQRCGSGTFSATIKAANCTVCAAGFISESEDTHAPSSCSACPAGKYQSLPGQSVCLTCGAGYFQNQPGQSSCYPCPDHTSSSEEGSTACAPCPLSVQFNGTVCGPSPCNPGLRDSGSRDGSCVKCDPGTYSEGSALTCTLCSSGKYNLVSGSSTCLDCATEGMTCSNGRAIVNSGYWSYVEVGTDSSGNKTLLARVSQCPYGYCDTKSAGYVRIASLSQQDIQDNQQLQAGPLSSEMSTLYVNYSSSPCSDKRSSSSTNTLCGACNDGLVEWKGDCIECPKPNYGFIVLVVIICVIYVAFIHYLAQANDSNGALKIGIYFVQVALFQVGPIDSLIQGLGILNFGPQQAAPPSCVLPLSQYSWMVFQVLLPYFFAFIWACLFGASVCIWLIRNLHRARLRHEVARKGEQQENVSDKTQVTVKVQPQTPQQINGEKRTWPVSVPDRYNLDRKPAAEENAHADTLAPLPFNTAGFVRSLLSVLLFSYQQAVQSTFAYLECVDVGNDRVLFTSPSVDCRNDLYTRYLPLVYVVLVVNVIGLPIGLLVWFYKHRHGIKSGAFGKHASTSNPYRRYAGVLFLGFSRRGFFWSSVVLLRQMLLVGLDMAFLQAQRFKYLAFLYFHLTLLTLHMTVKPFEYRLDNTLETVSLVLHTVMAGLLACITQPISSEYSIAMIILIFPWACCLFGFIVYKQIFHTHTGEEKEARIKFDANGNPIQLQDESEDSDSEEHTESPITSNQENVHDRDNERSQPAGVVSGVNALIRSKDTIIKDRNVSVNAAQSVMSPVLSNHHVQFHVTEDSVSRSAGKAIVEREHSISSRSNNRRRHKHSPNLLDTASRPTKTPAVLELHPPSSATNAWSSIGSLLEMQSPSDLNSATVPTSPRLHIDTGESGDSEKEHDFVTSPAVLNCVLHSIPGSSAQQQRDITEEDEEIRMNVNRHAELANTEIKPAMRTAAAALPAAEHDAVGRCFPTASDINNHIPTPNAAFFAKGGAKDGF